MFRYSLNCIDCDFLHTVLQETYWMCTLCGLIHPFVSSEVIWTNMTARETETVVLACKSSFSDEPHWAVTKNGEFYRIFSTAGMIQRYEDDGRYAVHRGFGFWNLTISNVTQAESGKYTCIENLGEGPDSDVLLTVLPYQQESVFSTPIFESSESYHHRSVLGTFIGLFVAFILLVSFIVVYFCKRNKSRRFIENGVF